MEQHPIVLKKVRVHNLKSIDLTLQPGTLIVFTGVSGSGKSSLAFDTIYVEGQRRYIESLSHQARRDLKRDLKRFAERKGLDGKWGSMMLELLDKVFGFWKDFREKRRTRKSLQMGSKRYRDEFEYGILLAAMKERHSISLKRFAKNLVNKTQKLWVFIEQEGVDPTNNQAERDLRSAVIWRKICHGTKSNRGDRFVERIQSVVATLARQGERCLNFLSAALFSAKTGQPAPKLFQAVCKMG